MPRRRDVGLARRRHIRDEDEAEVDAEGDLQDDSVSEDSGISEDDDFDDVESDGSYSDAEALDQTPAQSNGKPAENGKGQQKVDDIEPGKRDNHAMMNGIRGNDDSQAVDFAEMGEEGSGTGGRGSRQRSSRQSKKTSSGSRSKTSRTGSNGAAESSKRESAVDRRKREHEEYRKKRDADPAFVPNRGAFFMHDHRSGGGGANGFRPFGKGKGRGAVAGQQSSTVESTGSTWEHDMHEEVLAAEREREKDKGQDRISDKRHERLPEKPISQRLSQAPSDEKDQKDPKDQKYLKDQKDQKDQKDEKDQKEQDLKVSIQPEGQTQAPIPNAPPTQPSQNQPQNHHQIYTRFVGDAPPRSFGRTVNKGTVQIRVFLPGMERPIPFNDAPYKVYTRLPFHRPPLRRDKPVRIFLPGSSPKYIYPAHARSFVFIPRAMRPGGSRGGIVGGGLGPTPPRRGSYYGQHQPPHHHPHHHHHHHHQQPQHFQQHPRGPYSYVSSTTSQAPSVDLSHRSSIQQDMIKQPHPSAGIMPMAAPAQAIGPRDHVPMVNDSAGSLKGTPEDPLKPVVRLPASAPQVSASPTKPSAVKVPSSAPVKPPYPVPPRPVGIPMHQPRPQKTVSVENIESPAVLTYTPQPYATPSPYEPNFYMNSHSRAPSYPSQPSSTPHSLEHSIHARPFQPNPNYPPQPPPPHVQPPPNGYFYPMPMYQSHPQATAPQTGPPPPYVAAIAYNPQQMPHHPIPPPMPMSMQQQMHPSMSQHMSQQMPQHMPQQMPQHMPQQMPQQIPQQMPQQMPPQISQQIPQQMPQQMPQQSPSMSSPQTAIASQGTPVVQNGRTTIAHESNGTVYFYDPAQYYALYGGAPSNVEQTQGGVVNQSGMYYYPPMVPMPVMAPGPGQPVYYS